MRKWDQGVSFEWAYWQLQKAEEALNQGKHRYAAQLLEGTETDLPELRRKKQLLSARIPGADLEVVCRELPSLDEELAYIENLKKAGERNKQKREQRESTTEKKEN